jgi:hypothetical protein
MPDVPIASMEEGLVVSAVEPKRSGQVKFSRKFGARYARVLYILGIVSMFVVAAGADRKFK